MDIFGLLTTPFQLRKTYSVEGHENIVMNCE